MKDPRKVSSLWWFVVSMVCSLGFEDGGETAVKRLSAIREGSLSPIDARVLGVSGSVKRDGGSLAICFSLVRVPLLTAVNGVKYVEARTPVTTKVSSGGGS